MSDHNAASSSELSRLISGIFDGIGIFLPATFRRFQDDSNGWTAHKLAGENGKRRRIVWIDVIGMDRAVFHDAERTWIEEKIVHKIALEDHSITAASFVLRTDPRHSEAIVVKRKCACSREALKRKDIAEQVDMAMMQAPLIPWEVEPISYSHILLEQISEILHDHAHVVQRATVKSWMTAPTAYLVTVLKHYVKRWRVIQKDTRWNRLKQSLMAWKFGGCHSATVYACWCSRMSQLFRLMDYYENISWIFSLCSASCGSPRS